MRSTIRDVLDDPVRLIAFVDECDGGTIKNLNVLLTLLQLGEQSGFRICMV